MQFALIADTFPPLRTSGAVQLRDLSREFARQGHQLTVMLPASDQQQAWQLETVDGVEVLRLKAPRTKDINYIQRTLAELWMPFAMRRSLAKSPVKNRSWDGVIWYAPSIFHGPLASFLKRQSHCKGYLIIRDIFPEWAADMGLMGRGLPFRFFQAIARYQYAVADVIGIQTAGNSSYFTAWREKPGRQLEVLQNWLGPAPKSECAIRLADTPLRGRKVFVYAGNMGVAQGMDVLLQLAERLASQQDLGFLFVGRGSEVGRLKEAVKAKGLNNVLFFDEIHPDEIPGLYAQCHVGLVALDPRHKTHNIPGKFLTYMQSGLPVLAQVNEGNDLLTLIAEARVGMGNGDGKVETLTQRATQLMADLDTDPGYAGRCRALFERQFSAAQAVRQIVAAFAPNPKPNPNPKFEGVV
jgi:glycosyltransferase involved in cell wall biosynthesis